jgi:hypothetical protein
MANLQFNTKNVKRVPINRNNLFYSEESFNFEGSIGKNYIEQDMNQTAILYQVDVAATNVNDVYGETQSDTVQFKTPVEFHCVYKIEQPELKAYDKTKNIGTYMKTGKLTIGVYEETLKELGVDIKKGDYIGIQISQDSMIYFSVMNDGKNNYDNAHTLFGVRPLYRTINCAPVDTTEFQA